MTFNLQLPIKMAMPTLAMACTFEAFEHGTFPLTPVFFAEGFTLLHERAKHLLV